MKRIILFLLLIALGGAGWSQFKVACIGNSITAGGYPALLNKLLGNRWEVKNYGVSGATLLRKGDLPYHTTSTYTNAQLFHPDVVIIKLGTNDSKPQNWKNQKDFYNDYMRMISELQSLPSNPLIILCNPVPAYSHGWNINDSVIRYEIIPKIKMIAHDANVKLIDLYKPLSGRSRLFPDGIHPNEEGSAEIAKVISKRLMKYKRKIERRKRK